jgi:drug/metabolite transporter (DMT)-like permease
VPEQPRMEAGDWFLLVLLSILWGGSFFFSKIAVQALPPLTLVFARFALAAGALGLYLKMRRLAVPRSPSVWAAFAGMGALNNLIPAGLIAWGQTIIASGLASILIAMTPIFSILVAHLLTTDDRISPNKVAGIVLGIAGVVILVGAESLQASQRSILAMSGCLAAALSYGFANVFGRRFRRLGITPTVGAFGQISATSVIALPLALAFDAPWQLPVPHAEVWASMIGLAFLSTALGYVIFFRILASSGATNVSLVTLLIPVSAILLGSLVLGERLSIIQFCGMGLIGLGLIATDGRAWHMARTQSRTG